MKLIKRLSIHHKIMIIISLLSIVIVSISSYLYYTIENNQYKNDIVILAKTDAAVIGNILCLPLDTDPLINASKAINQLRTFPKVTDGYLLSDQWQCLAAYHKNTINQFAGSPKLLKPGYVINDRYLQIVQPIECKGKLQGFVYLNVLVDMSEIKKNRMIMILSTICFAIVVFIAAAFALQKLISGSFLRLSNTFSESNIASLQWKEELLNNGKISNEFSMMLDAIKNRELERDNAITALRESEKRFKTIVANIPGIVYRFSYDKEFTTMYISMGIERLTGYPPRDFIGNKFRKFTDIIHSADKDWFLSVIKQSIAQRKSYALEYRILTCDDECIWVRDEGQGLFDRDTDELLYVDGVILDITEQKNAENAVKESEERYKLLSNITIEGIIVHNKGIIIDANLSFCRMFGYELNEILNTNILDFLVEGEDKYVLQDNIANYHTDPYEIVVKRKNGTKLWVENIGKPFTYNGLKVTVMALRDISEYKKSQQALKTSEKKYRLLFENMTTAFALHEVICDTQGKPIDYRFLEINPAFEKYTNLKASNALNKTVREVLPDVEQYWIDTYGNVALSGEAVAFENYAKELGKYYSTWVFSPKKGQFAVIFTDVTERKLLELELQKHKESLEDLIKDRTKELDKARIAALNLAQDANIEKLKTEEALATLKKREAELHIAQTELKEALKSAEAASVAKSDFISQVSHELRTPLNAIIGYSQILKTYENITEEQLRFIGTIRASGDMLLSLINDILDFGKIEANEMEIVQKEFDLNMLISQIFDINKIKAEEKDLLFLMEKPFNMPRFVRGDERKLKQILLNLLSNAIKYTNSGSVKFRIFHRIDNRKDLFKFIIEDTGIGIAEEHLQTVFEPFKQVGEQSKFAQGTGLGLAITQKFINLLHGKLTVNSRPGEGSIFCIEVELNVIEKHNDTGIANIYAYGYEGERKKILVVDDNNTNVSIFHEFLKNLGFVIKTAKNGAEAIKATFDYNPDLILIDLIMPVMDGLEAVKIIRNTKSIEHTKIIGLSASLLEPEQKSQFISLCNSFINKPVDFDMLLNEIQKLLSLKWLSQKIDTAEKLHEKVFREIEIPNKKTLELIMNLLNIGNFYQIEEITKNLMKDEILASFCKTVQKHCRSFDDEKLSKFIQQFI
jgi:PAS domain S-box-containing protein